MPELYKRPNSPKWWARCYFWADGSRHTRRRSTGIVDDGTAKSRRTAGAVARQIEQSLATGSGRTARPTTVRQALARLVADMERGSRAQDTIDIVTQKAAHLVAFWGPDRPVEALTGEDLKSYADDALGARKPLTVHRELRTIRQAIRAVGLEPPAMPDLGRVYTPRERALTVTEARALVLATPDKRRPHVLMYLRAGLRDSELYKIGAIEAHAFRCHGTKTPNSDRWVPIADDVRGILEDTRGRFEPWGNADRDLKRCARRAGLGPLSLNDLRRTFATHMALHTPIHMLAQIMGTSVAMLEKVYAQVLAGDAQAAIGRVPTLCADSVLETVDTVGEVDAMDGA